MTFPARDCSRRAKYLCGEKSLTISSYPLILVPTALTLLIQLVAEQGTVCNVDRIGRVAPLLPSDPRHDAERSGPMHPTSGW